MVQTEREVQAAKDSNLGPYFFGTRLDFNYAVLNVPSPRFLAAWWEPGTSFATSDSHRQIELWKTHNFKTLIFLRSDSPEGFDHTFYPQEFLDAIDQEYVRDERFSRIVVYHRR